VVVLLVEVDVVVEVEVEVWDEVVVEMDEEVDVVDEVKVVSCDEITENVLVKIVVIPLDNVVMTVVDGFPVKDVHATEVTYANT
jgi:hypothetical protein